MRAKRVRGRGGTFDLFTMIARDAPSQWPGAARRVSPITQHEFQKRFAMTGLFGGGWEDHHDALNAASHNATVKSVGPYPDGASASALLPALMND
jgi:hypothetical protein